MLAKYRGDELNVLNVYFAVKFDRHTHSSNAESRAGVKSNGNFQISVAVTFHKILQYQHNTFLKQDPVIFLCITFIFDCQDKLAR